MELKDLENSIKCLFEMWIEKKREQDSPKVQYSGPVFGKEEYSGMLDAIFNNWWSGGKFTVEAERKLAEISSRNHALLSNSGSSANLLLMSAAKEMFFKDDDKILTLSCGFPTTVNPIITARLKPVFVDIDMDTLGLKPELLEASLKADPKIRGVFVAHTLGFKSEIDALLDIARERDVQVFFDCCDAYGTKYNGKPIQAYGKAASYSFYVAHHISMGEGGGVATNDTQMHLMMRGFRNWGRYCSSTECCIRSLNKNVFCPRAKLSMTCELPSDYMVNYQYEWLGYNLKPLDLQAAILSAQLDKIDQFDTLRRRNYKLLHDSFQDYNPHNIRTWNIDEDISPFAFPMLIPTEAPFTRKHLIDHLQKDKIESRLLFGGNLMRHPAYSKNKHLWESMGSHSNADAITERFLMIGVSQIITPEKIQQMIDSLREFMRFWK